ncbi:hypothetical protein BDBG_04054, partial [Blastomyces gilchristii SLH14081]
DEAGTLSLTITSSSPSALPLHLIFRSAANPLPFPGQFLASSSAVLFFAILADSSCEASGVTSIISLQGSAATVHALIFSFSEICAFLMIFISNILSEDCIILTYQNSQYESHVSASADILSAQMILK